LIILLEFEKSKSKESAALMSDEDHFLLVGAFDMSSYDGKARELL
jgi:hypothetical protein